jgi:predicted TIM-barrel fold metal-dependent hydrolase
MILSPLEQTLVSALEQMEIIDAHEHLVPEEDRVKMPVDVFTLFAHYTYGDLRSAGMSDQEYRTVRNHDLPLDYRWRIFSPYWERIRWTSYSRSALIAAREFYGADDINERTYLDISERMQAANTPGIYDRVLREACNIRTCLTQWLAQCWRTDFGTPLLTPVMLILLVGFEPNPFRWGLQSWSEIAGDGAIHSLDDLVAANRAHISRVKSDGAVGLKMVSHPFQAPDRKAAQEAFEQLRTGAKSELPMVNPLRDYVVDELIRCAGEEDLTIAVHTGYWGDFRMLDPLHMIPILQRHPEVRFDFYHLGYPWVRESLMLGKQFSNVWINFCWTHIISQRFAMEALDEAIDLLPTNKVIGFGGDYNLAVEKVYGHLVMAREDIARVLARRIERGQMTEDQAIGLARKWLWDNPVDLYRLKV